MRMYVQYYYRRCRIYFISVIYMKMLGSATIKNILPHKSIRVNIKESILPLKYSCYQRNLFVYSFNKPAVEYFHLPDGTR